MMVRIKIWDEAGFGQFLINGIPTKVQPHIHHVQVGTRTLMYFKVGKYGGGWRGKGHIESG